MKINNEKFNGYSCLTPIILFSSQNSLPFGTVLVDVNGKFRIKESLKFYNYGNHISWKFTIQIIIITIIYYDK